MKLLIKQNPIGVGTSATTGFSASLSIATRAIRLTPVGSSGASAYQVWLSLGNVGTEQDFIDSLSSGGLSSDFVDAINGANLPSAINVFQTARDISSHAATLHGTTEQEKATLLANTTKLVGIEDGATADQTKADIDALGINAATVNSLTVETAVPANAVFTDTETTTSLAINANMLTYTDELGQQTQIDLSLYLDDTNLARLTSGTIDGVTGIATFTRDDATTFTVDFSALLDDTLVTVEDNLTSISTVNALSANQGKILNDKINSASVDGGTFV